MIDVIGKKFNFLTVISRDEPRLRKDGKTFNKFFFKCRCDCGNIKSVFIYDVIHNKTMSCGCFNVSHNKTVHTKHNLSTTRFYSIYENIRTRTSNKNRADWKNYGGRGIISEWKSFDEFRLHMYENYLLKCREIGEKNVSIERIDVNKNYCKENCEWIDYRLQAKNKRNSLGIDFAKLMKETALTKSGIYSRYYRKKL